MNRDAFSGCHPAVNLLYFIAVIGMTMFLMHPVCLALSLACGVAYLVYLRGGRGALRQIGYLVPLLLAMAIINPIFNHEGITILAYLPNDNPITLEAICFGIASSVMMAASVLWFNCCSTVFTSDKIIYLFGRVVPAMSLLISMTLRFVPRFKQHLQSVQRAQRAMSGASTMKEKLRSALAAFSATVSWAMEQSIVSADSMKSRGYGLGGRTAFSIYRFDKRDGWMTVLILVLSCGVIVPAAMGRMSWAFYPAMTGKLMGPVQAVSYGCFCAMCLLPLSLNLMEDRKWTSLQSNI